MARIIVVDDREQEQYLLNILLSKSGHTVKAAKNGAEALTMAHKENPDMIISDILMPVMDGFTLCREWRKDPTLRAIPFVFYTATYTDPRDEDFALQLGADKFITKPTEPAVLLETIDEVFSSHSNAASPTTNLYEGRNEEYFRNYSEVLSRKIGDNLELFRAIFDVDPSVLLLLSTSQTIKEINWTAEQLLGIRSEDARDNNFTDQFIVPTSRSLFAEHITAALTGTILRKFECIVQPLDGPQRILRWNARRIIRTSGMIEGVLLIGHDITEQKAAEQQRNEIENQLRHTQKMEAIGQLAGGVAHDFNNVLSAIMGYCELMRTELDSKDSIVDKIDQIMLCSERAAELTRQLLAFSRKQVCEPKILNCNRIITDVEKMLSRLIGEHIELVIHLAPDLGLIKSDQGQLEQIIMNLAVNARDAMPNGGTLTIDTSNIILGTPDREIVDDLTPGPYVMIRVADTGGGIDESVKEHIFEPFFTTKEKGQGTGLGLAIVYGIVKQHRGAIACDSKLGAGTAFRIYLPLHPQTTEDVLNNAASVTITTGTETILITEDDPIIRNVLSKMLGHAGYTVLTAADGENAIHLAENNPDSIHLLLSDLVIPRISGKALVNRLREQRPSLKVMYTSGYPGDIGLDDGSKNDKIAFLPKPFTMQTLLKKVREVLDS